MIVMILGFLLFTAGLVIVCLSEGEISLGVLGAILAVVGGYLVGQGIVIAYA